MNEASARDFIDNFGKMLKGEGYARKNSLFQTELYLEKIKDDFGLDKLKNALSALRKHIDYYAGISTGSEQPGMERILAKYRHFTTRPTGNLQQALKKQAHALDAVGEFDPDNVQGARRWVLASGL